MNKIKCYIYNNIYQLLHITILQSSDSWRANMYQANTPYNILYRRLFTTSSLSTGQEICHFSLQKAQNAYGMPSMVVTKSRKCSGFVIYSYLRDSAVTAVTGSKWWHSGESADRLLPVWPVLKSRHPTPYVGWVCCWFSPLLWEVFLRVIRFSPLLKNQHFQIPIWLGIR